MGRCIIKLTKGTEVKYLEWSTVVDAPVTYGMGLSDLTDYIRAEYGQQGLNDLPERLERVEATGCSFYDCTLKELLAPNRAGPNESCLTEDEIWDQYCEG